MDPCKEKEPRVINNALIEKCLEQQGPKGEAGRLERTEGVRLEQVEHIVLEFLNILRIDHLWIMPSLTKLGLNNNLIERIENLDSLVHLKELDLSFNKISKIENLDKLIKLEKLSFYENQIRIMENMDSLHNLKIFSIGRNSIEDLDNVLYLRRLHNLRSLNMEGNPCAEDENFRMFVTTFLPQVLYYEYKLIQDFEKSEGLELFRKKLMILEESELKQKELKEIDQKMREDAELHSVSFVEYLNTNHLFTELFLEDEDGQAFFEIGDEVQDLYNDYKDQFVALCLQIFNLGQEQHAIREAEVKQFEKGVADAQKENQDKSIQFMEDFNNKKSQMFTKIRYLQHKVDENDITIIQYEEKLDGMSTQFEENIAVCWRNLMKFELELLEQMEELNQTFEHTLTEQVNVFIEAAQGVFSQMRALEVNYSEQISECAGRYLTNANLTEGFQMPAILKQIMSDKEAVANSVSTSHDMHLLIIDIREDTLISRAKGWLHNLIENLQKDEITRSRTKVLEISHFLDIQKEEFTDITTQHTAPIDPDISAGLF